MNTDLIIIAASMGFILIVLANDLMADYEDHKFWTFICIATTISALMLWSN